MCQTKEFNPYKGAYSSQGIMNNNNKYTYISETGISRYILKHFFYPNLPNNSPLVKTRKKIFSKKNVFFIFFQKNILRFVCPKLTHKKNVFCLK